MFSMTVGAGRSVAAACMLALVFGAAMTLSFAPTQAWWFTPICLAGLFMLADGAGAPRAGLLGLCFGLGWFGAGLWWMAAGLWRFTQAGLPLSVALCAALMLYLSLFPAAAMALASRAGRGRPEALRIVLLAACFTLGEWARATFFGGMPMLATGYAHARSPLGGFAPLAGVLGLCFLNALLAAWLAHCLPQLSDAPGRARWRWSPLLVLGLGLGGAALGQVEWTRPTGGTISVRLLQGNLPQQEKFTLRGLQRASETYIALVRDGQSELTVLPETALPIEWDASPPGLIAAWRALAGERNTALVIGALAASAPRANASGDGTNSALVLLPGSSAPGYDYRYDKVHLVPMGEQVPPGASWLAASVMAEFGALQAGAPNQPPLRLKQGAIALGICYESMFDIATAAKARDANFLLNISNYAWFYGSYASDQHLQAAQVRARETGRWFGQAANGGLTALIDQRGVVRDVLPMEVVGVLQGKVEMREGMTPFMQMGNIPLVFACLAMLMLSLCMPVSFRRT